MGKRSFQVVLIAQALGGLPERQRGQLRIEVPGDSDADQLAAYLQSLK